MAKAKFNENGELVNAVTGEVIGNKQGNTININSNYSEMRTLEDYGVGLPDFPEDEHESRKDEDEDFSDRGGASASPAPRSTAQDTTQKPSHIDKGPTTFVAKKTKYEVTSESYFVISFGLVEQVGGRFVPVNSEDVDNIPQAERHWVKFRMWNYGEELAWKSEFLEYDRASKSQVLNVEKLNERKIRHLMLDWSFGQNEDRLKLLHCDGKLSDESYSMFMGLYPSIANTIVNMMNNVLENNQ